MVCAIMISMNLSYAQSVARTQSASINPTEIYVSEDTEILTVITWNDATEVVSVELDFFGYIIELEENVDYVITEIDEFTSLFEFIEEDDFRKQKSANRFDDPWYITFYFDQGDVAILTLYPVMDVQYSVIFSVADYMDNPIDDAVVTFDGFTFDPGEYFLGFYYSGNYDFTIEKEGFETIEGEIIIDESAISEHFVMYPSDVYSLVSFHVKSQGIAIDQAEINIDGLGDPLYSDNQGMAYAVLPNGNYSYDVSADGYEPQQGGFALEDNDLDIYLELNVLTSIDELKELSINIFPNPANDFINITLAPVTNRVLTIFSSDGGLVHSQETMQTNLILNVGNYPKGIYLIKVQSGRSLKTAKFIKN